MHQCPHCESNVAEGILVCPTCNLDITKPIDGKLPGEDSDGAGEAAGTGTVNAPGVAGSETGFYEDDPEDSPELVDGTVTELDEDEDFEPDDFQATLDLEVGARAPFGGLGTVDMAPQDSPDLSDTVNQDPEGAEAADADIGATLDASGPVTDEEGSSVGDISQTLNAANSESAFDQASKGNETLGFHDDSFEGDDRTTLDIEQAGDESDAAGSTLGGGGKEHSTFDAKSGSPVENETVDFDLEDEDDAVERTMAAAGDQTASDTVDFADSDVGTDSHATQLATDSTSDSSFFEDDESGTVNQGRSDSAGDQTMMIDSALSNHGTEIASDVSDDSLRQLWRAVAGSSNNPMTSLSAIGMQASDSVFQRVAVRSVVDAQVKDTSTADYQIIDKLGEGAMGVVFSARQTGVDRVVALKTAKPDFQKNDQSRRRFLYEAHITADLDHSNIVPIHELAASEEGMLFYSMKLVSGTEWSRVIRKKTREENLEIFTKVTDAMAFAHSKGIIHRDLKPENTMLGQYGEVFVTDWGTAVNIEKETTALALPARKGDKYLTVVDGSAYNKGDYLIIHDGEHRLERLLVHSVDELNPNKFYFKKRISRDHAPAPDLKVVKALNLAGTPCYMAPEMAGNEQEKIGKRSDIYVLGAILYDMVIGKAPHTGSSVSECLRAAFGNRAVERQEPVDDALLTIALKAMASDQNERYQTVEELQAAVREYRRHAESITLSERSDELLEQAQQNSDYEMFSRAIFGYRDAYELWEGNTSASSGLKSARLAFGQAAFQKGDYDLVLQTVDRDLEQEAALYDEAVAAKKKAEGRESTLKLLQRAVAAVVLLAVVGLSGLSYWAFAERGKAIRLAASEKVAKDEAEESAKIAVEALSEAEKAAKAEKVAAEKAQAAAIAEKAAAELARKAEEKALQLAKDEQIAKNEAREAQQVAEVAKVVAENAQEKAEAAAAAETRAKNEAIASADLAKRRAAEIKLGEYDSSLALAKSQVESFDVTKAIQNLGSLTQQVNQDVFFGAQPDFSNWALERISLLSNADLPSLNLDSEVTATDFSSSGHAAVGTQGGSVYVVGIDGSGELVVQKQFNEASAQINSVALSPSGEELTYAFSNDSGEGGLKRLSLDRQDADEVVAAGQRAFQLVHYTKDGKFVIAGLNGGIWIWRSSKQWPASTDPIRATNLRGFLESIQPIDQQFSLICSRFQSELVPAVLDHTRGTTTTIELPDDLKVSASSMVHLLQEELVAIGLDDNRLLTATLDRDTGSVSNLAEQDVKHRAPISQMSNIGSGKLVTVSEDEPVAHVWQIAESQLEYDTYLTGPNGNMVGAGALRRGQILGIDGQGFAILWNVDRQKQRRQLRRVYADSAKPYNSAVQQVVMGKSTDVALAMDRAGIVDLWSLADGKTQLIGGERYSYIGHTPGAELVDSAVNLEQGTIVTAASLKSAQRSYLANPDHDWEFCQWDTATGRMQRRWTVAKRTIDGIRREEIEQRVSFADRGKQILFASDNQTQFVDLATQQTVFSKADFGTYFAVPNPADEDLVMLVKRSGALRLLNLQDPEGSWADEQLFEKSLADPSDIPMQGGWTSDGKRFYLVFTTGGLAVFDWNGQQVRLTWSTRKNVDIASDPLLSALRPASGRVREHTDIDLVIASRKDADVLHIVTRQRGVSPSSKLVSVRLTRDDQVVADLIGTKSLDELGWLLVEDGIASLRPNLHDTVLVDSQRVKSKLQVGKQLFVSTKTAQTYALVQGQQRVLNLSRTKLLSASGNISNKVLYSLHDDGSMLKFSFGGTPEWTRLPYSLKNAKQISLAPNGQRLAVLGNGQLAIIEPDSGLEVATMAAVSAVNWNVTTDDLVVAFKNGECEIFDQDLVSVFKTRVDLATTEEIVSVGILFEKLGAEAQSARRHIVVHSEDAAKGYVRFAAVDAGPEGIPGRLESGGVSQLPKGSILRISPTEGILISGDAGGTATVWYASPSWNGKLRQLFDLEGHRGAAITCAEFSSDGKTIVTADDSNRLYGWLSYDPLIGAGRD